MSAGFGFSAGDCVRALELISDVVKALRTSHGAAQEYQQVIVELEGLSKVLKHLGCLQPSASNADHVNAIRGMAFACQLPLQEFLSKLRTYEASLGPFSQRSTIRSAVTKTKWAIYMAKEVEKVRALIAAKVISIQLLLSAHTSEAVSKIEASTLDLYNGLLSRVEELEFQSRDQRKQTMLSIDKNSIGQNEVTHEILSPRKTLSTYASRLEGTMGNFGATSVMQDSSTKYLPEFLTATQSVSTTIYNLIFIRDQILQQSAPQTHPGGESLNANIPKSTNTRKFPIEVLNVLDKIIQQNLELYRLLLQIQRDIPQTPTQLLPDNIKFEDALGRVKLLPYAWFRHWEVFEGLLKAEFKNMPVSEPTTWTQLHVIETCKKKGERKVEEGLYQVVTERKAGTSITRHNWTQSVFPRSSISMSIVMAQLRMEAGKCPRESCKSQRVSDPIDLFFVTCLDCGLRFTLPSANRSVQPSTSATHEEKRCEDGDVGRQEYMTKLSEEERNGASSIDSTTEADENKNRQLLEQERHEIEHFRRIHIELAEPLRDDFMEVPYIDHTDPSCYQIYSSEGERIIGGVVALSADTSKVLVIRSVRRDDWVLPKGRWTSNQRTPEHIAIDRAWREAGIVVRLVRYLGSISEHKDAADVPQRLDREKELYCFFEAKVEGQYNSFPQADVRNPLWVSYQTAQIAFRERPEFMEALNRSSIEKSAYRRKL